ALNWVVHRPGVTAPIIGARTMDQLEDNLGSVGWQLEEEQWRALPSGGALPRRHPHGLIAYADPSPPLAPAPPPAHPHRPRPAGPRTHKRDEARPRGPGLRPSRDLRAGQTASRSRAPVSADG